MRRDDLFLADMIAAADAISQFIAGRDSAQFEEDDLVRSAVLQKLTVIGEGAARVSDEIKRLNPSIPWKDMVAFRNISVHRYFGIDWQIVWTTARRDVPSLRESIFKTLKQLEQE